MSNITIDIKVISKYSIIITEPNSSKSIEDNSVFCQQDTQKCWLSPKPKCNKLSMALKRPSKISFNPLTKNPVDHKYSANTSQENIDSTKRPLRKIAACFNLSELVKNNTINLTT